MATVKPQASSVLSFRSKLVEVLQKHISGQDKTCKNLSGKMPEGKGEGARNGMEYL